MANLNFQPDRLGEFAYALKQLPWPELEVRYRDVIEQLRANKTTAVLLADMEQEHYRFVNIAYKSEKIADPLPVHVRQWRSSKELNPLDIPGDVRQFFSEQNVSPLDAAQRYVESAHTLADVVEQLRASIAETDASLALALSTDKISKSMSDRKVSRQDAKGGPARSDSDPWDLFARALASGDVQGTVFLGGDVTDAKALQIEQMVEQAVRASGGSISWGDARRGSWWRSFKTAAAKRLGENDLDTLKRAAEVQLLDRYESESAKSYAEAIATLATAVGGEQHAYLAAKNVILLKTIDAEGRPVTVSRVLTPREVSLYQSGELDIVLSEPATALKFLRTGALPVSERRAIEGEGGD